MENKIRLQKIIAQNSAFSRRKAEELIKEGKVSVNGKIVTTLGTKASYQDEILIDGNSLINHEKVYYLLNKPTKTITSCHDTHGRTTVIDLVEKYENVFPVGRLDYYTTGLLLLTNDGELANGLMHPRNEIRKTYRVSFIGEFNKDKLKMLRKGVVIDNYKTKEAYVKLIKYDDKLKKGQLIIELHEGKNRQVRKMLEAVGCRVTNLKRIQYAFFDLKDEQLAPGEYRDLKPKEVKQLYNLIK